MAAILDRYCISHAIGRCIEKINIIRALTIEATTSHIPQVKVKVKVQGQSLGQCQFEGQGHMFDLVDKRHLACWPKPKKRKGLLVYK